MNSMLKNSETEKLQERWLTSHIVDKKLLNDAFLYSISKTKENLKEFTYACPSITAPNGKYYKISNELWTTGFWPGMVWIAYAHTGDESFFKTVKIQSIMFKERLETDHYLRHHDIGFLYSLSTVADYIMTGDEIAKETSIDAAYRLTRMYRETPGIIQRGGDINDLTDNNTGVFIVDCMNNVPLLFWAHKQTNDKYLYDVAYNHMKNTISSIITPNGKVFHSGVANVETGIITVDPDRSQGKGGEDACWARGQAWAIAGLPIAYEYTGDIEFLIVAKKVILYFLNRMPTDLVANWDLFFTDDETQRDTSASAIAVSGMLGILKYLSGDDEDKEIIENAAYKILESLTKNYLTINESENMGLLNAGVYCFNYKGTNEPSIYGDYYYMESLYRIFGNDFKRFW